MKSRDVYVGMVNRIYYVRPYEWPLLKLSIAGNSGGRRCRRIFVNIVMAPYTIMCWTRNTCVSRMGNKINKIQKDCTEVHATAQIAWYWHLTRVGGALVHGVQTNTCLFGMLGSWQHWEIVADQIYMQLLGMMMTYDIWCLKVILTGKLFSKVHFD